MGTRNQDLKSNDGDNSSRGEIDELLDEAREYHAAAFPNTARQDCPGYQELVSVIKSEKLPDAGLRRHLLSCSDCFRDFQAIRQTEPPPKPLKAFAAGSGEIGKSNSGLFFRPFSVGLMATGLLLISIFAFYLLSRSSSDNEGKNEIVVTTQPQTNTAAGIPPPVENAAQDSQPDNLTTPLPPEADDFQANRKNDKANSGKNRIKEPGNDVKKDSQRLIAQNTVQIDVEPQSVWRDGQAGQPDDEQPRVLKAAVTRLQLNIPPEYPAGRYEISFYNESGKKVTAQSAVRRQGGKLQVTFDLRNTAEERLRLCLAPEGEVPDCYPVKIVRKGK
ncbi:MAG: hypothetical protein M3384_10690 [Acidobacteriota bacterium]|nr:hypothetical protein [Acidobacteriota bacterium]